jgi:hypothetical protein
VFMTVLLAVAAAVAVTGALILAAGKRWTAPAVALGYVAGHFVVSMPAFPPVEVTDRLPWLALAAGAWGVVVALGPLGKWATVAGRASLLGLTLGVMLWPVIGRGDLARETVVWVVATTLVAVVAWVNLGLLAHRNEGVDARLGVLIAAAGSSPALLLSGSATLGFLAAVLTAALSVAWLLGRKESSSARAWEVGAAVLVGLLVEGYVYAFLPATAAALLGLSPLAAWMGRVGLVQRRGSLAAAAAGALAMIVVVGIAVGISFHASPAAEF